MASLTPPRPAPPPDFAAAGMLRLIELGLRRQGLAPPPGAPGRPAGALVSLDHKRALAAQLLQRHGPLVLLRIGEAAAALAQEVPLQALVLARDPPDLLQRWQRLERFVHSRHRVQVLQTGPGRLRLRHVSLRDGAPPTAAEDALVFGLLVVLAECIGSAQFTAHPVVAEGAPTWQRQSGQWVHQAGSGPAPAPPGALDLSTWDLAWQPAPARAANPLPDAAQPPADLLQAATDRLMADPGRAWTVHSLAAELGRAPRSLQRQLALAGSSFGQLLGEARAALAARLLTQGQASAAEIGYVCGYADQAHFTRAFKRQAALTPALYRAQFAAEAALSGP